MRYVIHIGAAKTGTKYLQTSLAELGCLMRKDGICYPTNLWAGQGLSGHHELYEELTTVPNAKLEGIFAELNACNVPTVLLSSESFMWLPKKSLEYLQELINGAKADIVFCCRRWSDWVPSMWKTYVGTGSHTTFLELYGRFLATPATEIEINYCIVLDLFAEVFGRESLHLISYSNLMDNEQDIFEIFCQKILKWNPGDRRDRQKVGSSPDMYMAELIRCLHSIQSSRGKKTSHSLVSGLVNEVRSNHDLRRDVAFVTSSMASHIREIVLDDNLISFLVVYSEINQKYADRLINPEYDNVIFDKRASVFRYITQDYLLEDGVSAAVRRIYEASSARGESARGSSIPH